METSQRPRTIAALQRFREIFGAYPRIHVNHSFNRENLYWGAGLDFAFTPRNEPIRLFLEDPSFRGHADGMIAVDLEKFRSTHSDDLALFALIPPSRSCGESTG